MVAFQFCGEMYYRTYRNIYPGVCVVCVCVCVCVCACVCVIEETHGYVQEYQWARAPVFERDNIVTVSLFRTFQPQWPLSAE